MIDHALAVITQALRENPDRANQWCMRVLDKRIRQEQDAQKLRRIIEFKTEWRHLYQVAKEAKE